MPLRSPPTDPRRASALRARLERIIPALAPRWAGPLEDGSFGRALVEIAARLGEETTSRLALTPQRDALAFFDALDIAQTPPHSAQAVLAFALNDARELPVFAPARTQVGADVNGTEVIFETRSALDLTPARLAEVIAVDPGTDRIEKAPQRVVSIEAPEAAVPRYEVVSFAAVGSERLHVNPAGGLKAGDLIRIDDTVYRLGEPDGDLLTLEDPLTAAVPAGEVVETVSALESFSLRNLQVHEFFLGHAELLNLEQTARLSIHLAPAGLAARLSSLGVQFSLWGTAEPEDDPAWHRLGLLSASGSTLQLAKPWVGSVDELEIKGLKSRWIKANLAEAVTTATLGARASRITVSVESVRDGTTQAAAEANGTVTQGFHNNTPLAVSGRFLPFGPEPQRFDTFAIAAPEALSKKGATVDLHIALVDASLTALTIAISETGPRRAYGIGRNGRLQALAFDEAGNLTRWQQLDPPPTDDAAGSRLDGERGIHAVMGTRFNLLRFAGPANDIVVAQDKTGRLFSGLITEPTTDTTKPLAPADWASLPTLDGHDVDNRHLAVVDSPSLDVPLTGAFLFAAVDGELRVLRLDLDGIPSGDWQVVNGTAPVPILEGSLARVVSVHDEDWPAHAGAPIRLVVADSDDRLWSGEVSGQGTLSVSWTCLDEHERADRTVRPAATLFEGDRIWVAYASSQTREPRALAHDTTGTTLIDTPPESPRLAPDSAMHASAAVPGVGPDHLLTTGLGVDSDGDTIIVLWGAKNRVRTAELPRGGSTPEIFLFPGEQEDHPDLLVLGGADETLYSGSIRPLGTPVKLHDGLVYVGEPPAQYVELTNDSASPRVLSLEPANATNRIMLDEPPGSKTRVYLVEDEVADLDTDTESSRILVVGDGYRFLRRPDGVTGFDGTFEEADRTRLALSLEDTATSAPNGEESTYDVVIVDGESYNVLSIEEEVVPADPDPVIKRTATLDRAMAGTETTITYQPVTTLAAGIVAHTDLGTLVHLPDETRLPPGDELFFPEGADPSTQGIQHGANRPIIGVWVRLDTAWTVEPADGTIAELDESFGPPAIVTWAGQQRGQDYQNPELSWEYFDGRGWRRLEEGFADETRNLASPGSIRFEVPPTIEPTEIAGQEDYWIRARLIGGDYGRAKYTVVTSKPTVDSLVSSQTVTIDTSDLRPPEIASIEATFRATPIVPLQQVLVRNNLTLTDQTQAAAVDQAQFELVEGAISVDEDASDRALYLGFTKPIGSNPLALYADVVDQAGEGRVRGDILTPQGWHEVVVEDETEALRRRGLLQLFINVPALPTGLFDLDRFWVRLRAEAGPTGDDWAPVVRGLYVNAARASQGKTIEQEILGSSLGEPDMTVELSEEPVLPDSVELRVREELSDEEHAALSEEERQRRRMSVTDVLAATTTFDNAPGTWVLWHCVDSFVDQDGDARVYLLDSRTGLVTFGNGRNGRIPPAGRDAIRAFAYQTGAGHLGNVKAWTQVKNKSSLETVDTVILPVDAAGGFDAPGPDSQILTANERLRHAGQALTPSDFEALAVSAAPGIVRARCFTPTGAADPIRVVVSKRDGSRRPVPSLAERTAIARQLRSTGWGGLGDRSVEVTGPTYVRLRIVASLLAAADRVAEVEQGTERALLDFLHPTDGGPTGGGWPFGRRVWPSDLLRVLDAVEGVERITELEISTAGDGVSLDAMAGDALIHVESSDVDVRVVPGGEP